MILDWHFPHLSEWCWSQWQSGRTRRGETRKWRWYVHIKFHYSFQEKAVLKKSPHFSLCCLWFAAVTLCGLELKIPLSVHFSMKISLNLFESHSEGCIFWSNTLSLQGLQRRRPLLRRLMHSLWSVQLKRRRWVVTRQEYTILIIIN